MPTADVIRHNLELSDMVVKQYLDDLTDEQLILRPAPGMNHIAWQLGHLIASEHKMIDMVCPGVMPPLPPDFAEQHAKETAASDAASMFLSKQEYPRLMDEQRQGTFAALVKFDEEALAQPTPEQIRYMGPTTADVFNVQAGHWLMHSGQWVVVRRTLGKPPLF